jgi:hypothetical protein
MNSRLSHHGSNKLVTEEHGFDKEISTENAAFRVTDTVLKSVNQKMHVGGIFCDFAKALDCRNHEILLADLHFCGI